MEGGGAPDEAKAAPQASLGSSGFGAVEDILGDGLAVSSLGAFDGLESAVWWQQLAREAAEEHEVDDDYECDPYEEATEE